MRLPQLTPSNSVMRMTSFAAPAAQAGNAGAPTNSGGTYLATAGPSAPTSRAYQPGGAGSISVGARIPASAAASALLSADAPGGGPSPPSVSPTARRFASAVDVGHGGAALAALRQPAAPSSTDSADTRVSLSSGLALGGAAPTAAAAAAPPPPPPAASSRRSAPGSSAAAVLEEGEEGEEEGETHDEGEATGGRRTSREHTSGAEDAAAPPVASAAAPPVSHPPVPPAVLGVAGGGSSVASASFASSSFTEPVISFSLPTAAQSTIEPPVGSLGVPPLPSRHIASMPHVLPSTAETPERADSGAAPPASLTEEVQLDAGGGGGAAGGAWSPTKVGGGAAAAAAATARPASRLGRAAGGAAAGGGGSGGAGGAGVDRQLPFAAAIKVHMKPVPTKTQNLQQVCAVRALDRRMGGERRCRRLQRAPRKASSALRVAAAFRWRYACVRV